MTCMQPYTRNSSVIWVAAIYLTAFYSAEVFYKQVASLYTWKGLSPEPNWNSILRLTQKLEPHVDRRLHPERKGSGAVPVEGSLEPQLLHRPKAWPRPALLLKASKTL